MPGPFRDAKFTEDTAKLIESLGGQQKSAKKIRTRRAKPDAPATKAKETAAAAQILKDHARRRTARRQLWGDS